MRRYRVRPRRRLGQNFLVDRRLRDQVVDAAGLVGEEEVLEVGAGAGALTVALAGRCRRLVAVELDERLVAALRSVLGPRREVEVVQADVLRMDLSTLFPGGGEVVVGNIPYYLTGALVTGLLQPEPRPRRLSLVVQAEVARRWTAAGDWSLASVAVHVFAHPRVALRLPAGAFWPSPKVDSALVVMEMRGQPAVPAVDLEAFFGLVAAAFQQRRKQLGNSLGQTGGRAEAASRLWEAGVDPRRRPQTLSLEEWWTVYRVLKPVT